MPHPAAAPVEADALRRLAEATKHVHFPAPVLRLLLALLALLFRTRLAPALPGRRPRTPRQDWHFSPTGETIDDLAPILHPRALRRLRRQRAWIGWILRGRPGRGMRRSGKRAPNPSPTCTARAPP